MMDEKGWSERIGGLLAERPLQAEPKQKDDDYANPVLRGGSHTMSGPTVLWVVIGALIFIAVRMYDESHPRKKHPCEINPDSPGCEAIIEQWADDDYHERWNDHHSHP